MLPSVYGFLLSLVLFISLVAAAPVESSIARDLSPAARRVLNSARKVEPASNGKKADSKNGKKKAPAAPHWVVYADTASGSTGAPPASDIEGFTVFSLSFLLLAGAWDKAYEWTSLTADQRASIKSEYEAAGIKLIVSAFGATDVPTSSGADPETTAASFAQWVKDYNLDGLDVDYEDFNAFNAGDGSAEEWLIAFTKALRADLPAPDYIVTHAPVAPWFSTDKWGGGGYLKVHEEAGDLIDWYNLQFYNQGETEYTTCDGLLNTSSDEWPNSALFQIIDSGVEADKLVIGKPARASGDANNGYIAPETLAECLATAKDKGWSGGAMVWQYPYATEDWIATVRSKSWPV